MSNGIFASVAVLSLR